MKFKMLYLLLFHLLYAPSQKEVPKVIHEFIADLDSLESIDKSFLNNHYSFTKNYKDDQIEQVIWPLVSANLILFKDEYLNKNKMYEIVVSESDVYLDLDTKGDVILLMDGNQILLPFLIQNKKIVSTLLVSKSKNGTKRFKNF